MTLVMLSGGLDSTTVLFKLLSETDKIVFVHHTTYLNSEERARCELYAVNNIVDWCDRNIRQLYFTKNAIDFRFMPHPPWDYQVVAFVAAQICQKWTAISEMAVGLEYAPPNPNWPLDWHHARNIFDSMFRFRERRVNWIFPVKDMTKLDEFNCLPRELYDLTWSCRTPVKEEGKLSPCKNCPPCASAANEGFPLPPPVRVRSFEEMMKNA